MKRLPLRQYGLAIAMSGLALLIALALLSMVHAKYYAPFLAAVTISAWYGGLGPGLLATLLCGLALDYFYEYPTYSLAINDVGTAMQIVVFILAALLISALNAQLRNAYRRAKAARIEAEEAIQTRDQLLSTVTHDLKNPLATIKLRAQLLRRDLDRHAAPDPDHLHAGLTRIDETATRMVAMIDTHLDLARLRGNQPLALQQRPTDLVALVRKEVEEWRAATERHHFTVETTVPSLVGVWDAPRLERVFDNLLSNAVKYSPEGGTIAVTVARDGRAEHPEAIVRVRDEGMGIPAADVPHIFTRFARAGNVVGRIAGTGIGLAGARQVIEQHGGTISVESTEGAGTEFTIRLPLTGSRQ